MHHICLVRRFGELTTAAGNITRLGSVNLWRPDMYDPLPNGGLIRKLWISETDIYRDHLLRLDGESRRRRFSGAVADEFIVSHGLLRYLGPSDVREKLSALPAPEVSFNYLGQVDAGMVFSPNAFRGAPHTHLATLAYPGGSTPAEEASVLRAVAKEFPMVTTVRVKDALDAVGSLIANLVLAIRGASAITLIAAALVLGGALAAGHRHRVYDAVILKTLGATRLRLLAAYGMTFGLEVLVHDVIAAMTTSPCPRS